MADGTTTTVAPPGAGTPPAQASQPAAGAQNAPTLVQQTPIPPNQAAGARRRAPSTPQAARGNGAGASTPRTLTFNNAGQVLGRGLPLADHVVKYIWCMGNSEAAPFLRVFLIIPKTFVRCCGRLSKSGNVPVFNCPASLCYVSFVFLGLLLCLSGGWYPLTLPLILFLFDSCATNQMHIGDVVQASKRPLHCSIRCHGDSTHHYLSTLENIQT